MMKAGFLLMAFFYLTTGYAQTQTTRYNESIEDFVNPERGFYLPLMTTVSHFVPLDAAQLTSFRNDARSPGKAVYAVRISLVYRSYELDGLTHDSLPAGFLQSVRKDFETARQAGMKLVLRFAYTEKSHSGNCPDKEHICPLYGDAPLPVVLNHIRQLKPLLRQNSDVIAVMQEGFIGIWGEGYYTDYFGDASGNGPGFINDSSWRLRNEVLKAELDALPSDRMIQVRTPQAKQKFLYGPAAPPSSAPLEPSAAFNRSYAARIAFHNDCFLSSPDDYGTYGDYSRPAATRNAATDSIRKYISADSKYIAVGGETCDDAYSPENDCAPAGHATQEMRLMHYSFLNASYNVQVNNDWDSAGCMQNIKKELGYRLSLQQSIFPRQSDKDKSFSFNLRINNSGYASPFNPRPVQLVFRGKDNTEFKVTLPVNPQEWYPGIHEIPVRVYLPAAMLPGTYSLLLALPDAAPLLAARSVYSIRLANENTWEETTGYNDLKVQVKIR